MADQTSSPIAPPEPSIVATGLDSVKRRLEAIPPGKKGVFVITADWKYGIPVSIKGGFAHRIGDSFSIGSEGKYQRQASSATAYVAWAWLLLFALVMPSPAAAQPTHYPASLVRVVDGDTYVLRVDLGFDVSYTATIRLADLDTAERFTPEGRLASAAADAFLRSGKITVQPTGAMTFARHVGHVYVDGVSVAKHLLERGHRKVPAP